MSRTEVVDESIRAAAAEWFARQQSSAMSAGDVDAMEQWLQEDTRHRLAFAQCQQLCLMSDMLKDDPELNQGLPEVRKAVRRRTRWRWISGAAAVVLVAVSAVLIQQHYSVDYYQTAIGEQRVVHLQDGSTLMLNTNSRVGVRYARRERGLILEKGEAFFMVAKNPARPFVVNVQGSEVRALGTAFNVALREGDVQVAVTQGVVEVKARDRSGHQRPLARMLPGQGVRYRLSEPGENTGVIPINLEKVTAWQTSRIYFDDERLEDAIAEYNRYTTRKVVLVGDGLADERISGVFNIGDADALAFALEQGLGARVNKNEQRILVLPALPDQEISVEK
ncbi:FecR family protein [Microbulbifer aggregans]|uniref:FecR family protein n=1 Tax=Microbulbifer aggregans TaxID=1769779 RepID=UPI001CFDD5AF|nr:FecR domain-containing protein [Microbulbifer aggregans]